MERNLQGGGGGGDDVAPMHVKTEALEENTSAGVLGRQEPPAPCGDTACRGGGGGGGGGVHQTAEELADTTTTPPVLLYPVSTERFFTTSADGKTYLKIAPASVMPPAPSEKMIPSGSDFSSKAVLCLIEAVGRRWGLYETRERSQLFQSVQEEMASMGHVLPVEKIRRKWNNLIVTYKRVKDRSRETGHAKTSWEFFDLFEKIWFCDKKSLSFDTFEDKAEKEAKMELLLMDATLCDTVGTQIISNKRSKGANSALTLPCPSAKVAAKPPLTQSPPIIRPNSGDFDPAGGVDSGGQGAASSTAATTSVTTASISPTSAPELKPLIVLNGVATSIHPATIVPSPSFISSPCFTDTASSSPSFGSSSTTEPNASRYMSREAPPFSSGVIPFRLSAAPTRNNQNLLSLSTSFTPTSSCLTSSAATSLSSMTTSGAEGQNQKGNDEPSGTALYQEILKRQEEQAYLDRVARRRVEAREKRRERREVRMAESLGRIATALELLSSKQDTVIALLQRLADRK